jgi:hypothetical protein
MKLYPDLPRRRAATLAADAAVLLALLAFAWVGLTVHDAVEELTAVSRGVQEVGGTVERSFEQAGEAVGGAPLVGGQVRDALQDAGRGTGGRAVAAGREGESSIRSLADLLGWLSFVIPGALLLSRFVPPRVEQVRKLTAAQRVLATPVEDEQRRALLAQRAAFGLPYATLLRYTDDPLGDLAAGRLGPLLAAVREDAGLSRGA